MSGTSCASHEVPAGPPHVGHGRHRHAGGPAGTTQPGTDAAKVGAVHPVPKIFRSKERQS